MDKSAISETPVNRTCIVRKIKGNKKRNYVNVCLVFLFIRKKNAQQIIKNESIQRVRSLCIFLPSSTSSSSSSLNDSIATFTCKREGERIPKQNKTKQNQIVILRVVPYDDGEIPFI